jgi:hypothetical protein
MSSDAIEGERSHLESTLIFSLSMPTPNIKFKPILDPYDSSYALSPKPPDDPRNPCKHPTHRILHDHKEDQEEHHQWQKSIKNLCGIAIE